MNKLLLTGLLLAGLAAPIARAEDTAANAPADTAAAPAAAPPAAPAAPAPEAPDQHGISISIDANDKGDGDENTKFKAELHGKILDFVDKALKESDVQMSAEDKKEVAHELAKEFTKDRVAGASHDDFDLTALAGLTVAAIAITLIFGTPVLIVAFVVYASYRKRRLVHDTINGYVASGKEIPPDVLKSFQEAAAPRRSNLHRGMVMVGVGLGIIIAFKMMDVTEAAALGAIPLFIGLAQLLIWKLEKNGNEGKSGN